LTNTVENSAQIERVVKDIYREAVEAILLYTFISEDMDILHRIDFINKSIVIEGFFEFLGEVRRLFIDEAIKGNIHVITKYLEFMDSSYRLLFSTYFPNYYFPDYKRRIDILRSQVEKSKEDYIRIKYGGKNEY
jgi:predicted translin family RNA/ssDNA-binding protein